MAMYAQLQIKKNPDVLMEAAAFSSAADQLSHASVVGSIIEDHASSISLTPHFVALTAQNTLLRESLTLNRAQLLHDVEDFYTAVRNFVSTTSIVGMGLLF